MSTFLLIGKSFFRLRDYLDTHGHSYVTLLDDRITKISQSQNAIACDFSSTDKTIAIAQIINKQHRIDGVIATYENYILPAAHIARSIGVPGLPIGAAEACTDKELMREKFAQAPQKISPEFQVVKKEEDLLNFASKYGFPLILKPANLAKSLLVTKANNKDELLFQYTNTLNQIDTTYSKYAPNRQPKLIVEEFIDGTIHSVDAFIDSRGKVDVLEEVVDYETGQELGYNDNFHYSRLLPSNLTEDKIQAIRQTAAIGCKALGMANSPAHIEIILSSNGPRIVEIGARNGGYRDRMYELANGIDIIGCSLAIAIGKQPQLRASRNESCVVLELFPKHNGIFQEVSNERSLERLGSLAYYSPKVKPGKFVGKSADGYKTCAVVMLHNKDKLQLKNDYEYVRNNVFIVTKIT